jgi:hypothetical protein
MLESAVREYRTHRLCADHAPRRMRMLIRARTPRAPSSRALLRIQVLECGVCSGKMRALQLSRAKELDSTNRLSANFSRGAT